MNLLDETQGCIDMDMKRILYHTAKPDFESFSKVVKGESLPRRVHLFEHEIDGPFQKKVFHALFDEPLNSTYPADDSDEKSRRGAMENRIQQDIRFRYHFGYDTATLWGTFHHNPTARPLKHEYRTWAQEDHGLIQSWDDLEKIAWDSIIPDDRLGELYLKYLTPGMKCVMCSPLWHKVMDVLFGHTTLFMKVIEEPELVKAVIDIWGQKVYDFYSLYIGESFVGGIFHGDDLGHKTGPMIRPKLIKALLFPWFKKYADLAHEHGKLFALHSCGHIYTLMDAFIDDLKIDAFHSFQDDLYPVTRFKKAYGHRVSVLGGADVDCLSRKNEPDLRAYLRDLLNVCMEGGRYVFGSGNSVTDYIPVKNWVIMIEEAIMFSEGMR